MYGEGLDAHAYLQKFITIEAKLPKKRKSVHQNDLGQYARYLLRAHQIQTWGDDRNLIEYVDLISNELDVSLRQLEKVFSVLAVFYASTAENNLRLIPLIVLLAFAKVVHPHIFNKLLAGRATYSEVVERFGFSSAVDADENGRLWSFSGWVRYSLLSEQEFNALPEDDPIRKFGETELWRYNISRERLLPVFAELIGHFVP